MFQFIFAKNVRLIKFRIKPKEDGNEKQKYRNSFVHFGNRLKGVRFGCENARILEGQKCQLIEKYCCETYSTSKKLEATAELRKYQ